MISPEEIRERARRLWVSGRPLRAWLGADTLFPCSVPMRKPSAREWLERYAELRHATEQLENSSKARCGHGYALTCREVTHQKLGRLRVPELIVFETVEDLAACAGEMPAFRRFERLVALIRSREPRLIARVADRPLRALEYEHAFPRLLDVVAYVEAHPRPMRFARELDIPGVDSKFIEAHESLLAECLDLVLPASAIDASVRGLSGYGFERRFGLRHEEALLRFRWLDPSHALGGTITEAAVPVSQLSKLAPTCRQVLVTENKVNFLTLPEAPGTMALFGGGYAIELLDRLDWLRRTPLHYWGDLDTHGFAILDQLRSRLPHTRSFLMDRETLMAHREQWCDEPPESRCTRELAALAPDERALYDDLRCDRLGLRVRLEQERVGYDRVRRAVQAL